MRAILSLQDATCSGTHLSRRMGRLTVEILRECAIGPRNSSGDQP